MDRELLIEIIAPAEKGIDARTVSRAMQRFYDLGLRPDWWKLEPARDAGAWANVNRVIEANDPHCRGVVLLGLSAPEQELVASFAAVAHNPVIKGFAVGRTIFADVAERWMCGEIDDDVAVTELSARFSTLVSAWREARAAAQQERGAA